MSRSYLGASQWSHCDRKMWFAFRQVLDVKISSELQDIFDIGHFLEDLTIKRLKSEGYTISDQQEKIFNKWGKTLGHIDGKCQTDASEDEKHLLEIKSSNNTFAKKMDKGDIEEKYLAQINIYMTKLGLKMCMLVVYNKDNSKINKYFIPVDEKYGMEQIDRMEAVISNEYIPIKNESYQCRWCDYNKLCREGGDNIQLNCRTCANVDIKDGDFQCRHGYELCGNHLFHPDLIRLFGHEVSFADGKRLAIDYGGFVNVTYTDVKEWNEYASRELVEFLMENKK